MRADQLLDLVFACLHPAVPPTDDAGWPTAAQGRVDRPGILPTQQDEYPRIKVRMIGETKQSQGRGSVGFTTTTTIRIVAEGSAPVSINDANASAIEGICWDLKQQIETAIINSSPLFAAVQQLASVQTQIAFDAQATMLGGVQSDYTFEFYEDESDFAPIAADDVAGFDVHLPAGGPGFSTTSIEE